LIWSLNFFLRFSLSLSLYPLFTSTCLYVAHALSFSLYTHTHRQTLYLCLCLCLLSFGPLYVYSLSVEVSKQALIERCCLSSNLDGFSTAIKMVAWNENKIPSATDLRRFYTRSIHYCQKQHSKKQTRHACRKYAGTHVYVHVASLLSSVLHTRRQC